jgi:hypothetical protein
VYIRKYMMTADRKFYMLLKKSDIAVRDVVENFSLSFATFLSKIKVKSIDFVVIV